MKTRSCGVLLGELYVGQSRFAYSLLMQYEVRWDNGRLASPVTAAASLENLALRMLAKSRPDSQVQGLENLMREISPLLAQDEILATRL